MWYICYSWWANINTLLLTKVHSLCLDYCAKLIESLSFHQMSFFYPGPHPGYHTACSRHVSLGSSWLGLPCFWWFLTVLMTPGQVFFGCPPDGICLIFSPWLNWRYGLGRGIVEVRYHSIPPYQERLLTTSFVPVDVDPDYAAEVVCCCDFETQAERTQAQGMEFVGLWSESYKTFQPVSCCCPGSTHPTAGHRTPLPLLGSRQQHQAACLHLGQRRRVLLSAAATPRGPLAASLTSDIPASALQDSRRRWWRLQLFRIPDARGLPLTLRQDAGLCLESFHLLVITCVIHANQVFW